MNPRHDPRVPARPTLPYIDFRERWPVDFKAANDAPDPWLEPVDEDEDRLAPVRFFRGLVYGLLLTAVPAAVVLALGVVMTIDPPAPLPCPAGAECPVAP